MPHRNNLRISRYNALMYGGNMLHNLTSSPNKSMIIFCLACQAFMYKHEDELITSETAF